VTDVSELFDGSIQLITSLSPNFPNPFGEATTVVYTVARPSRVRLTVYDVTGRRVSTLVDEPQPAGRYGVRWDGAAATPKGFRLRPVSICTGLMSGPGPRPARC
jgi:hypothetical protein